MIYLASIQGFGDNLITLSLLEKAAANSSHIRVVGNALTNKVGAVMKTQRGFVEELFQDVAAFYVMKQRGLRAAFLDVLTFRRWAAQNLSSSDILIFEKGDWRNRWLCDRGQFSGIVEIARTKGAYEDRATALSPFIGSFGWVPCAIPDRPSRSLVVNPGARADTRRLPKNVLRVIFEITRGLGIAISMIDFTGSYENLADLTDRYLKSPTLADAVTILRQSDRYIGPDSFFLHLAYYYEIPFLGFFRRNNLYFAPPGMIHQKNFIADVEDIPMGLIEDRVLRLLRPHEHPAIYDGGGM